MNDLALLDRSPPPALPVAVGDDLVRDFMSQLGPKTRLAYAGDLRDFARTIGARNMDVAVTELLSRGLGAANTLALRYKAAMMERQLAPATIARRLSALRSIAELAARLGRVDWVLRISSPKVEAYRDVEGPGREGFKRIVRRLTLVRRVRGRRGIKAARDLAICRLCHDLMLRRGEVIGLDLEHVEREMSSGDQPGVPPPSRAVWVLGKGRSGRESMSLPPITAAALDDWLRVRGDEPGPVFTPLDHACADDRLPRLSDRSVARIVRQAGVGAGLAKIVKPHGLRHEAITRAIELGEGLLEVQLVARHKDPRTTQKYIDRAANPQPRISRLISED